MDARILNRYLHWHRGREDRHLALAARLPQGDYLDG